jgi:hypothetical protein
VARVPLTRFLKDTVEAMQAASPHQQAGNANREQIIALVREVEDERSGLSPEERAARRRQIDELTEQARRESDAARGIMDKLKAQYPRWIK